MCSAQYCRLVLWDAGGLGFMENWGQGKNVSVSIYPVEKTSFCLQGGRGKVLATLKPKNSYRI